MTEVTDAPTATHAQRPAPLRLVPTEVQEFLMLEADLLDRRELDAWLALYTRTAVYWMPAEHGDTDPEQRISLFYDDRSILEDRVWRLGHPKMFSQNPPVRQVRVLSQPTLAPGQQLDAAELVTHTKFIMFEHRLREQRTFGGTYEHHLVRGEDGEWMVARKVVQLVNCDTVLWNIGVPI